MGGGRVAGWVLLWVLCRCRATRGKVLEALASCCRGLTPESKAIGSPLPRACASGKQDLCQNISVRTSLVQPLLYTPGSIAFRRGAKHKRSASSTFHHPVLASLHDPPRRRSPNTRPLAATQDGRLPQVGAYMRRAAAGHTGG